MEKKSRLQEAIKQIDIVIKKTGRNDVIRELEDGRASIQKAQESLGEIEV